jgi:hypothetical protein
MGIVRWIKRRIAGDTGGADVPPHRAVWDAALNRTRPTPRALGEYDANSYPADVATLLRRRQEVADALIEIDVTTGAGRQAAIPQLRELLRVYPHPLAYEMLIHAYMDGGRWDEAKGVAWAAAARRAECARSPHPEIRAETDRLDEWSPAEVEAVRAERAARAPAAG